MHALLLAQLNEADQIDWQRALIDASFAKAPEGGEDTGPNPTDRGKSGSKHHVLTDAHGIPLAATVTAANVNEVTQVFRVLSDLSPVGGKPGPKRQKVERLQGDRGYDSEPVRQALRWLGITPILAVRVHGARQRPGRVPLVRGADDCLVARLRSAASATGSAHRDPRGVPPAGLLPHLFEDLEPIMSFFPNALRDKSVPHVPRHHDSLARPQLLVRRIGRRGHDLHPREI